MFNFGQESLTLTSYGRTAVLESGEGKMRISKNPLILRNFIVISQNPGQTLQTDIRHVLQYENRVWRKCCNARR